jgi:tetratricopeptide (TPR) repeat protein
MKKYILCYIFILCLTLPYSIIGEIIKDANYFYEQGNQLVEKKKFLSAKTAYLKSIELNKNFSKPYLNTGNIFMLEKDFKEAIKYYNTYVNLNMSDPLGYTNLGNAYFHQDKFYNAEVYYKIALGLDENYHRAFYNLGLCYWKQNKLYNAIQMLKKATEIMPENKIYKSKFDLCKQQLNKKNNKPLIKKIKPKIHKKNITTNNSSYLTVDKQINNIINLICNNSYSEAENMLNKINDSIITNNSTLNLLEQLKKIILLNKELKNQ